MSVTKREMVRNCKEAIKMGNWIRQVVPKVDLYIPAEHEDFVYTAWKLGYLNEDQILDVDCRIISKKQALIVFSKNGWKGGGIGVEMKHARKIGIPIFCVEDMSEKTKVRLQKFVWNVVHVGGKMR